MLKISFITTLGVNVGDEFIREGIRAVLDRCVNCYSPLYINKHDAKTLSQPFEDEPLLVADKYWDADLVIQAGAPVYWHLLGGKSRSVDADWHNWLWRDRVLAGGKRRHPVFVNLGAGSCQPWADDAGDFLKDKTCRDFAEAVGRRALVTTVRDNIAARILQTIGISHQALPCPAFLAGARHRLTDHVPGLIGVNLMPLGAHYDLSRSFDREDWQRRCTKLCRRFRKLGRLVFICHNDNEAKFAVQFATSEERIFVARAWRDYLDMYALCHVVVANRVHGAVAAAGLGVPSLIMGNDTRAYIGEYIGLPIFCSQDLWPRQIAHCVAELMRDRDVHTQRLSQLRDDTLSEYSSLIAPAVAAAHAAQETMPTGALPSLIGAVKKLFSSRAVAP